MAAKREDCEGERLRPGRSIACLRAAHRGGFGARGRMREFGDRMWEFGDRIGKCWRWNREVLEIE
eukprot:819945-Rhodomonas_salina.2